MDQLDCQVDRAASARIIMIDGATKTPINKIDDLPIEINGIIVPIKVLIMEATQYQALVGNDWLSKTNTTLDWNTQELQLSQNGQHIMKIREKKKKKKKKCYQLPPFIISTLTTLYNNPIINGQDLYASIVTRNCHQWAHAVAIMRNTTPQQSSTVIYAYSNALDNQRGKENEITNLVSLVERSC
ncbi:hypothetical protein G9A89_022756 [Geosiphon pyriformis]|nr:hypothetical protein G9A89_022756 [Geosiphon pyriformis]